MRSQPPTGMTTADTNTDEAKPAKTTDKNAARKVRCGRAGALVFEGIRVHVNDIVLGGPYGETVVLARIYGPREAVKAIWAALAMRRDVYYCRDEEAVETLAAALATRESADGVEGSRRLALEADCISEYRRHHTLLTPGISVMTLLHPGASPGSRSEGPFFLVHTAGDDPSDAFAAQAHARHSIPVPRDLYSVLWQRIGPTTRVRRLTSQGAFDGYSVSLDHLAAEVQTIIREAAWRVSPEEGRDAQAEAA